MNNINFKINYDRKTGKILGYYADDVNYSDGVPEPYIEVSWEERQKLFNAPKEQEFYIDIFSVYDEIANEETKEFIESAKTIIRRKGTIRLRDRVFSAEEFKQQKIQSLENDINIAKLELSKSDYKAIKYIEGLISSDDYSVIKAERELLRTKIRSFETKIEALKSGLL